MRKEGFLGPALIGISVRFLSCYKISEVSPGRKVRLSFRGLSQFLGPVVVIHKGGNSVPQGGRTRRNGALGKMT